MTPPLPGPSDILAKSKAYVKACQDKKADEIFDSLGDDCLAYGVIKKANAKKHRLMDLKTGQFKYLPEMGSFVTLLDGRMRLADVQVILGQQQTWTYSRPDRRPDLQDMLMTL
jgi:hypothetical protein